MNPIHADRQIHTHTRTNSMCRLFCLNTVHRQRVKKYPSINPCFAIVAAVAAVYLGIVAS